MTDQANSLINFMNISNGMLIHEIYICEGVGIQDRMLNEESRCTLE